MTDAEKELRKLRKRQRTLETELALLNILVRQTEAQIKAENGWKAAPPQ